MNSTILAINNVSKSDQLEKVWSVENTKITISRSSKVLISGDRQQDVFAMTSNLLFNFKLLYRALQMLMVQMVRNLVVLLDQNQFLRMF